MNNLNDVSTAIFSTLAKCNKTVSVHSEANILIIRVGQADTRIMNWESMSTDSILEIAKSLVLKENYHSNTLLYG